MNHNPLKLLNNLGQSIWLDFIDRSILNDGTLAKLIQEDGVTGLTSNPAIFEKAISHGSAYAEDIARLKDNGLPREALYNALVVEDVGRAADFFLPVYERTEGRDGFVSIEVSPLLARDSEASVREARDLWAQLSRPNIMIKIPGTEEGLSAVRTLLTEGINVNVTLLFSVERYARVLDTYLEAMKERQALKLPLDKVASVASFFLSRIDTIVDSTLDKMLGDDRRSTLAQNLRGQAAVASAASAYRHFQNVTQQQHWIKLAQAGAKVQRLLWASTGTKDPAYSDIKYIEPLIAEDTVNTLPRETLDAYRDHGQPSLRIEQSVDKADEVMQQLASLNIDISSLMQTLEQEGIKKFVEPYNSLLSTLERLRHTG